MLQFLYTCPRHQQTFIEITTRAGCCDPEKMDAVGRKALAWLAPKFPSAVLDHFNERSCLGCKLEANGINTKEIERVIAELSEGVSSYRR